MDAHQLNFLSAIWNTSGLHQPDDLHFLKRLIKVSCNRHFVINSCSLGGFILVSFVLVYSFEPVFFPWQNMFSVTMQFSWKNLFMSSWPPTEVSHLKKSSDQWNSIPPTETTVVFPSRSYAYWCGQGLIPLNIEYLLSTGQYVRLSGNTGWIRNSPC